MRRSTSRSLRTDGLRADDSHQIMLPAGAHQLRLTNARSVDAVRQVNVKPGEETALQLAPEPSTLTVTAAEAAEVWLDGTRIGMRRERRAGSARCPRDPSSAPPEASAASPSRSAPSPSR
jgi:hypothetical protein